ncbi:MAG: hypothetical protein L7U87_01685 [Chlamydiales bacterium]|nr:hypothetical protein [Chlamydiales bacterium]
MQIRGLNSNASSYVKSQNVDIKKNDAIDDLFNNSSSEEEDSSSIKLRLSKTLQNLQDHLVDEVDDFLGKNPTIKQQLEEVELPSNEYTRYFDGADFTLRKLKSYMAWQNIDKMSEQGTLVDETHPFKQIEKEGKDEEIKKIFNSYEAQIKEVNEKRRQNTPNYYYLFFPETYNFN